MLLPPPAAATGQGSPPDSELVLNAVKEGAGAVATGVVTGRRRASGVATGKRFDASPHHSPLNAPCEIDFFNSSSAG